jgi:hypothetical protein
VLRGIAGPQRYQAAGGWRELRNEELHDLHSSQNTVNPPYKGQNPALYNCEFLEMFRY